VQVDPNNPKLKPLGSNRLKLKYDDPPSNFAFKFNLRRYNEAEAVAMASAKKTDTTGADDEAEEEAGPLRNAELSHIPHVNPRILR